MALKGNAMQFLQQILRASWHILLVLLVSACSQLGKMDIKVSDTSTPSEAPLIISLKPENPKKGDVVTIRGSNFKGSSLDGILVRDDNIRTGISITITAENEGYFHVDDLPDGVTVTQVLIVKQEKVVTTFSVPAIEKLDQTVEPPSFSLPAGDYGAAQLVTLASATEGAVIYFTVDGNMPDENSGQIYIEPITVSQSMTIKAIAVKSNKNYSAVSSATYRINGAVAKPLASLPSGTYSSDQLVALSTSTVGATILYTTDGSTPRNGSSVYSAPLSISSSTILKAIAIKEGYTASEVVTESYSLKVAKPAASLSGGFFTSSQSIALSTATPGAAIFYTLDGSSPTISSTPYTGTIAIVGHKVLQAIAVKAGYLNSDKLTEDYVTVMELVPDSVTNGDGISMTVTELTNGNIVVAKPNADIGSLANVGSVSLYNGSTGALISVVTGSTASDQVGASIVTLPNGNFLIRSVNWDCQASLGCSGSVTNAGAVTWVNGSTGLSGEVKAANSLIGVTASDAVGTTVKVLTNGNYVVASPNWDCQASVGCSGTVANVGAVTWGSGSSGVSGFVSPSNSLVGSTGSDRIGYDGVTALTNGNYVTASRFWDCQAALGCSGTLTDVGAATWGNGSAGVFGYVSATNSFVGSSASDAVGSKGAFALTNGNYVVGSPDVACKVAIGCAGTVTYVGAATWGNGSTGLVGFVSVANSLMGSTSYDAVGTGVTVLTNGNYVVQSGGWDCLVSRGCSGTIANVGAATWGNGSTGISGFVSTSNSLVGSTMSDLVGDSGVTALPNGNYLVRTINWDCQASLGCSGTIMNVGAVTFANGASGITGFVSASNSLVGSTAQDQVGYIGANSGITVFSNSNYLVRSLYWDCQSSLGCSGSYADVGAVTWGSGTTGVTGFVSTTNSVVGSTENDQIGSGGIAVLSPTNYVVISPLWDCQSALGCSGPVADVGAVTWGNSATGLYGFVSPTNSLVGSSVSDQVGYGGVVVLSNGNYVVNSYYWDCQSTLGCPGAISNAGAATWGNGTTGTTGFVSAANSLVGGTTMITSVR